MSIRQTRYVFLKKCFLAIKIVVLFFVLLVLFVLLRSYNASGEYGSTGKRIDNEVFASIRDEIGNKKDPELAVDGEVFWTPTGTIWHLCSDCSFIKDSKTVLHGTVDEAKTAGMQKCCSRCYAEDQIDSLPAQDEIEEGDVFWTPSGSAWHCNSDCSFIKDSKAVLHGTVDEAKTAGMEKGCSRCYADDETDSLPQDEIEEGDVFWTPSGGVWHLSQDCRYIKNSSNVCYGNVEEAKNAGKTGVCSSCGKE